MASPLRSSANRIIVATAAALFVVTAAVFAPALFNGFVNYDDPDYVTSNAHVKAGLNAAGVRWALTANVASNWHPLTWMSHMLDVSLFGLAPAGHHATSVLLHALVAALAFLALRRLTGALWPSAACAALLAFHPLRVESVAWVSERKDVLCSVFFFLTLWAYARYCDASKWHGHLARDRVVGAFRPGPGTQDASAVAASAGRPWLWYSLALLSFALGLTAKPMLVTLPCVLVLLDFWPLGRVRFACVPVSAGTANAAPKSPGAGCPHPVLLFVEKLPFLALAIASSKITYVVQSASGAVTADLPFGLRLANAVMAVPRYLGKIFWPTKLAVLYPHPGHWAAAAVFGAAAAVLALSVGALAQWRRRPWVTMGWLWFLGMLIPVIGLVQVGLQSIADRYTYLPVIGLDVAFTWTVVEFVGSRRRALAAITSVLLAALALATSAQIRVWKNPITLFTHTIATAGQGNYLAYDNRGIARSEAGDVDGAIADFNQALRFKPDYPNANNNLGRALAARGQLPEAIAHYRTALRANPEMLEVHNNLANALSDAGRIDEAIQHYEYVLQRQPDHLNALNGYAAALAMKGNLAQAQRELERVLQLDPRNLGALGNLGNVYAMLGKHDEAVALYRRALEKNPNDAMIRYNLGNALTGQGRLDAAVEQYRKAIALSPVNPDAHATLGSTLARLGRRDEAVRELEIALQQRPGHPQARAWLDALAGRH
jgi:tetratricopeptide (TPR) repeat protein